MVHSNGRRGCLHAALALLLASCMCAEARLLLQQEGEAGLYVPRIQTAPSPAPSPGAQPGLYVPYVPPQQPAVSTSPSPASPSPSPSPQPSSASPSPQPSPSPAAQQPSPSPQQQQPSPSPQQQQPAPGEDITIDVIEAGPASTGGTTGGSQATPTAPPTNASNNNNSTSNRSSGLSTGALVGIIVGAAGAALLAAAACATILVRRRRRKAAAAAAPPPKDPAAPAQLPAAFGSEIQPYGSGPGPGPGPGPASFVFGSSPGHVPGPTLLPASATVPVPATAAAAARLQDPPARCSSGPAALADTQPAAHPAPAAAVGLEGWLAHSSGAAAAAAPVQDPSYPPIDPLLQLTPLQGRGPASPTSKGAQPSSPRDPLLAIPEDTPLTAGSGTAGSSNGKAGADAKGVQWGAAAAAAAAPGFAGAQAGVGSDDTAPVADIAASPFAHLLARGAAAAAGTAAGGSSPRLGPAVLNRDASGPLSPVRPAGSGGGPAAGHPLALPGVRATNAAAAPAGATAAAAAAAAMPLPIGAPSTAGSGGAVSMSASPFAGMFGGQLQQQLGDDDSIRSAAVSTSASPFAGGYPLPDSGVYSASLRGQHPPGAPVSMSASPFAGGLAALTDDGSLSSAVMAAAADAAASAASSAVGVRAASGTPDQGWSGVSKGSSMSGLSGSRQGYPPQRQHRYSTDTGSSSTAADRSWQSTASSGRSAAAAAAPPPTPRTATAALLTGPQAAQAAPAAAAAAAPAVQAGPSGPVESGEGGGGLAVQASVAPKATRYMSGPRMDPHWDFGQSGVKPVRVMLQVNEDSPDQPVSLILLVSAPPPRPEVLAQIVLPLDPPQAGVDMAIDANRDLAFPSNSFLGAGAFGQVHRALYRGSHPVAVKMLTDPGLRNPDEDTLRSFREELSIMAKLTHPHILRCYGGNLEGPNPFIVTELCECSLDKMILYYKKHHGSGLPLRHTLTVGLHVAAALWHLHPSIVHRDLKPQNVLLDIHGTAKVADFGLSRIKTHTYLSTTQVTAGTASYMAPECFAGGHVGEKADVYSLGCLLWECVTGERPWRGLNVVQVAYQVAMAHNKLPLPAADPTTCPQELVGLLDDCFSSNPKERPSSGEVMKLLAHMIRTHLPDSS